MINRAHNSGVARAHGGAPAWASIYGCIALVLGMFLLGCGDQEERLGIQGVWFFAINTTSGNGTNIITFSGQGKSGTFVDQHGHGGPWRLTSFSVGDSIYWEYTTGATLPSGLVNKMRGMVNINFEKISASSQGAFDGQPFNGTWLGTKMK